MAHILYLTHRMPFPPDKGDKITTFNFLRHLATKHSVHLGAFVDSEADWAQADELKCYCASSKLIRIDPLRQRAFSTLAFLQGASISEVYHRNGELQNWVDGVVRQHRIGTALAYCSAMAPYVAGKRHAALRRVTHYADVDSEKWRTYAATKEWPMSWVYGREASTVLALERRMSTQYDITSFVSDADAALYRQLAPESADKVRVIPNGVDTGYFAPEHHFERPYAPEAQAIVFTGAMDYWPNADAVTWFAKEVFGLVKQTQPQSEFWIVGSKPSGELKALENIPGVHVTGRVPDVRPYLAHAGAVVAPLRVARGTQNKVLEAYAMCRAVVMTSAAANGLLPAAFVARDTHDEPAAMAAAVGQALRREPHFPEARQYVIDQYSWAYAFGLLDQALQA